MVCGLDITLEADNADLSRAAKPRRLELLGVPAEMLAILQNNSGLAILDLVLEAH